MIVNIIPNYNYPDLLRQTPGFNGHWNDYEFRINSSEKADFTVLINAPTRDLNLKCRKHGLWLLHQEVLFDGNTYMKKFFKYFDKIITQSQINAKDVVYSQTALPWHVNKSFDELLNLESSKENKKDNIVWITGNSLKREGHRKRMKFLDEIKGKIDFDLYGRGFKEIDDKFEVLYPAKYNIAIENSRIDHYWTEKISDAYLSWCMPIYCGDPRILDYFPEESMILIDVDKPEQAIEIIKKAVAEKKWDKNLDAIAYARNKILNEYQLFPFLADLISKSKSSDDNFSARFIPFDGNDGKGRIRNVKNVIKRLIK